MNRKREQAQIIFKLGQLFGPVLQVIANPAIFTEDQQRQIAARFYAEHQQMIGQIGSFCRGQAGHDYMVQATKASREITTLVTQAMDSADGEAALFKNAAAAGQRMIEEMLAVPVDITSSVHEATAPFSTYCLVKDLCSTTAKQVIWMDRYFDHTLFHRYLMDVPKNVPVSLVTYPKTKCSGAKDISRYDQFLDVSRLFAVERGQSGYRLVTDDHFHDRWLRCDDKLFVLGGSIKDIGNGNTFTISKLDPTPQNFKEFDDPIARGTEVFGPTQPVHP